MKHWTDLMILEDHIIKLESLTHLFKAANYGFNQLSDEEMQAAMWHIESELIDVQHRIQGSFQALFEAIRNEEIKPKKKGKKNAVK